PGQGDRRSPAQETPLSWYQSVGTPHQRPLDTILGQNPNIDRIDVPEIRYKAKGRKPKSRYAIPTECHPQVKLSFSYPFHNPLNSPYK
ncbi:AAEL014306-PA, partial [Aedes aegypti]